LHDNLNDHQLKEGTTEHSSENFVHNSGRTDLHLAAIVCVCNNAYSAFIRDGLDKSAPWVYVGALENGELKVNLS